jgi:hypothetical protein
MTEVLFLPSNQGYQTIREQTVADRLRTDRPDVTVRVLTPQESAPLLTKYKLKFGPAVVIDNRLEFVGIPRYRMLVERIEISKRRALAPPPAPAAAVASPPRPAAPVKPGASPGATAAPGQQS